MHYSKYLSSKVNGQGGSGRYYTNCRTPPSLPPGVGQRQGDRHHHAQGTHSSGWILRCATPDVRLYEQPQDQVADGRHHQRPQENYYQRHEDYRERPHSEQNQRCGKLQVLLDHLLVLFKWARGRLSHGSQDNPRNTLKYHFPNKAPILPAIFY